MRFPGEIKNALLHLAFPHVCEGCGTELFGKDEVFCVRCLSSLPQTNFHLHPNNPVEKLFWGRLPLAHATAQYYFTKESLMQQLMHHFKYKNGKDLGHFLGRMMGQSLAASNRFSYVDALIPLPLFASREKKRGYNQAAVLCNGISEILNKPVLKNIIRRREGTESQTRKGRIERWQNMEGKFELTGASVIEGKHVLLVDDVVTTGATLEACGQTILQTGNIRLSVATLCFSSH